MLFAHLDGQSEVHNAIKSIQNHIVSNVPIH